MAKSGISSQGHTMPAFKNHVYTMAAAFVGVVFGVIGSMGFITNYMQSQFAAQTAALDQRLVSFRPAASVSDMCYAPNDQAGGRGGYFETAAMPTSGGQGVAVLPDGKGGGGDDGDSKPTTPFVQQLINGSITNTGPGSTNTIAASNNYSSTVTNNNSVKVNNTSSQTANSGDAVTSHNTTGGTAQTGTAHNQNATSTAISIKND